MKWNEKELAVLSLYNTPEHDNEFFKNCPPDLNAEKLLQTAIAGERDPELIKNAKVLTDVWQRMSKQILEMRKMSCNEKFVAQQKLTAALDSARDNYKPFYFPDQAPLISLEEKAAVLSQVDDEQNLRFLVRLLPLVKHAKFVRLALDCTGERLRNAFAMLCALKYCTNKKLDICDGLNPTVDFSRAVIRAAEQVIKLEITPAMVQKMQVNRDSSPKR